MLLDRETLDLLPRAPEVVEAGGRRALQARAAGRAARDQPAARAHGARGVAALAAARRDLAAAAAPVGRLAARRRAPVRGADGELNAGERYALTERRVRPDRAAPARLRAAGPRRRRRRRPRAGRLQRPARRLPLIAALAANAPFHDGATPGWPRSARRSPSCCRARASRRRSPRGRRSPTRCAGARVGRGARAAALVVGAAAASGLRDARGARARRAGDGRRRGRGRRRSCTRSSAWLAARHDAGEALARRRHLADGGEPLVGCRSGLDAALADLRTGARDPGARAASPRCSTELAPAAERARLRARSWRRRAAGRGNGAAAPARGRRAAAGHAPSPRGSPTRYAPERRYASAARERRSPDEPRGPRTAAPRGDTSAALLAALREPPHHLRADRRRPTATTRSPTTTSSSRSTSATSCTTAGCPASTSAGSGRRRCSRCARALERRFEARAARRPSGARPGAARPRRWTSRCARSPTPTTRPSLSRHIEREATLDQLLEFLVHRSAYQLKEADPHSWAIPRLSGAPKAALVEIQADEYGGGRPERMHARLFADTMEALGLDAATAPTSTRCPAATLATVNLMSLCGLHRRLRGAIVGHLALFEMTSSIPNRRYANGLRRLGVDEPGGDRASSTSTSRPTRCTRPSPPSTSRAGSRGRAGARRRHPLGRERARGRRGRWARPLLDAWAEGRCSLRPSRRRGGGAA